MRRRQIRRFIEPPLSASLALRLVFSSALSLEVSSAAAVQCFSGKSPTFSLRVTVVHPWAPALPLFKFRRGLHILKEALSSCLREPTSSFIHRLRRPLLHPTPDLKAALGLI
ncbi:hypothetical protein F2Q69_00003996 [Brassica cretica]|uniref:Secreted protein n=1 Tax=Brassica cretica TaxID=69181 RepID=A0A8S9NX44_BRACR|nr:hypothetical protein F2Q69_00003996 [Brassica cretica]